jgi:hypothetical protein
MCVGNPVSPQYAVDGGSRYLATSVFLVQHSLNGTSPILAQDTVLAQVNSRSQNALFGLGTYTIPSTTALTIGKREPIQSLSSATCHPQMHRTHVNPKLFGDRAQCRPRSNAFNHLPTSLLN